MIRVFHMVQYIMEFTWLHNHAWGFIHRFMHVVADIQVFQSEVTLLFFWLAAPSTNVWLYGVHALRAAVRGQPDGWQSAGRFRTRRKKA